MKVLVLNSGSSSIKFQLFDMQQRVAIAWGMIDKLGASESSFELKYRQADDSVTEIEHACDAPNHQLGLEHIAKQLSETQVVSDPGELAGIGHRVVHGGEAFHLPSLITDEVMDTIRQQVPLAPLHNPANIVGIEVAIENFPAVPQVAVFDTAFHQTIPPHAYHYALPREIYDEHRVRRYGFHGTSHGYVSKKAAEYLDKPADQVNLIVLHLGNGASVTAVRDGQSVDTSMGMTPLEGLMMGTRCGDLDPAIVFHLAKITGKPNAEIESMLNKQSGLKGICGASDMREVVALADSGDKLAQLAIDMYTYRIKKYIGAYSAVLGRVDAVVFTGGIGENASEIRAKSCQDLEEWGIELDAEKNRQRQRTAFEIQTNGSRMKVLVVPTNEELEIAEQTVECIRTQAG